MKFRILLSLTLLLLAVTVVARPMTAPPLRKAMPPVSVEGVDGGFVDLEMFRGRPILMNFWATWCGPCRQELPVIQRFYDRYAGDGLVVLPISTDTRAELIPPFLKRMNLSLPVYRDVTGAQSQLGVSSIPTSFLIDADGKIAWAQAGYSQAFDAEVDRYIRALLEEQKKPASSNQEPDSTRTSEPAAAAEPASEAGTPAEPVDEEEKSRTLPIVAGALVLIIGIVLIKRRPKSA